MYHVPIIRKPSIQYDPATAAAITTLFVATVGTGVQVQQSTQARKASGSRAAAALKQQREQIAKIEESQDQEKRAADEQRVREAAKNRQRKAAAGSSGRSSTILTSPLGVQGGGAQTQKTLTGS